MTSWSSENSMASLHGPLRNFPAVCSALFMKMGHVRCQVYLSTTSLICNMVGLTKVEKYWQNKSFYFRWYLGSWPVKEDACVFQMPLFSQGWKWNGCFPTTTYCCFDNMLCSTRWWNTKLLSTALLVEHLFMGQWDAFIHLYFSFSSFSK